MFSRIKHYFAPLPHTTYLVSIGPYSSPILFLVIIYISFSYSMVSSTPADTSGKYVLLNR